MMIRKEGELEFAPRGAHAGEGSYPLPLGRQARGDMAVPPPGPVTWGPGRDHLLSRGGHEQRQQALHQRRYEGTTLGINRGDRPLGTGQEMVGPGGEGRGVLSIVGQPPLSPLAVGGVGIHLWLPPGPEGTCQLPGDSNPPDCLPSTFARPP